MQPTSASQPDDLVLKYVNGQESSNVDHILRLHYTMHCVGFLYFHFRFGTFTLLISPYEGVNGIMLCNEWNLPESRHVEYLLADSMQIMLLKNGCIAI